MVTTSVVMTGLVSVASGFNLDAIRSPARHPGLVLEGGGASHLVHPDEWIARLDAVDFDAQPQATWVNDQRREGFDWTLGHARSEDRFDSGGDDIEVVPPPSMSPGPRWGSVDLSAWPRPPWRRTDVVGFFSGADGNRTHDPLLAKQVL